MATLSSVKKGSRDRRFQEIKTHEAIIRSILQKNIFKGV